MSDDFRARAAAILAKKYPGLGTDEKREERRLNALESAHKQLSNTRAAGRIELTERQRNNLHMYNLSKHGAQAADYTNQVANIIEHGYEALCGHCGGTGNQLLSHYQTCTVCKGTGIHKEPLV